MLARKDAVVKQNNDGIVYLFKKNKVTFLHGRGSFAGKGDAGWQIAVEGASVETISGRHVIVATGSSARACLEPIRRKDDPVERRCLVDRQCPKKIGIVGSGVIGLEMGSVLATVGAEVTILEALRPSSAR